jgi:hypothetical protein
MATDRTKALVHAAMEAAQAEGQDEAWAALDRVFAALVIRPAKAEVPLPACVRPHTGERA